MTRRSRMTTLMTTTRMRMSRRRQGIHHTWYSQKMLAAGHKGLPRWLRRPSQLRATPRLTVRLDGRNENAETG